MKVLAFTDNHGSFTALKKVEKLAKKEKIDVIICCGDISIFGEKLDKLIDEVGKIGLPVMMLHGNHESPTEFRNACERNKHNILFIHKLMVTVDDLAIIGYGGGGFRKTDEKFRKWSQKIAKQLFELRKKIPNLKVVFATHGPPYGTKTDLIIDSHVGNKDFLAFAKQTGVDLFVTGHIHECEGAKEKIGKMKLANPGPYGVVFEL